jgi:ABC-type glycerol-3-phosphate transport system substrate-binding protein
LETITRLFIKGETAYYIGYFNEWQRFQAEASEDRVGALGVTILPSGPLGPSRPLIQTEVLYFNSASSAKQENLALELALFLTNSEQNNALLREAGLIPANQRVRVNSRVYPDLFPFVQAGRTAVTIPIGYEAILTGELGNAVYTAVLSGVKEPREAVCDWQAQIIEIWPTPLEGDTLCEGG